MVKVIFISSFITALFLAFFLLWIKGCCNG